MWMCLNPKFYSNVQQGATSLLAEPFLGVFDSNSGYRQESKERERVEDMQQRVPGRIQTQAAVFWSCAILVACIPTDLN